MMEIKEDLYLVTYEQVNSTYKAYTRKELITCTRENLYRRIVEDVVNNRVTEVKMFSMKDETFHPIQLISDKLFQKIFLEEKMSTEKERDYLAKIDALEAKIKIKKKELADLEADLEDENKRPSRTYYHSTGSLTGWENVGPGPIEDMGN